MVSNVFQNLCSNVFQRRSEYRSKMYNFNNRRVFCFNKNSESWFLETVRRQVRPAKIKFYPWKQLVCAQIVIRRKKWTRDRVSCGSLWKLMLSPHIVVSSMSCHAEWEDFFFSFLWKFQKRRILRKKCMWSQEKVRDGTKITLQHFFAFVATRKARLIQVQSAKSYAQVEMGTGTNIGIVY